MLPFDVGILRVAGGGFSVQIESSGDLPTALHGNGNDREDSTFVSIASSRGISYELTHGSQIPIILLLLGDKRFCPGDQGLVR